METLPVTLIVKAPNQQIEDQTIKCELSWTINKLKQHLSEVYPSKPPKHEQKLIYSGQLLSDSLILKDILRQYEGQETHTVHLVCTPKFTKAYQAQANTETTTSEQTTHPTEGSNSNDTETDQGVPNMHNIPNIGNMGFINPGMDPNQFATQVAMMQQAYIQYMTQYMHIAAQSYSNGVPVAPQQQGNTPDQEQQQNAQAPPPQAVPAQRDPDNPERDWLDVFYFISRALVLSSVVYFYSSPLRFIFVLLLAIGLYLYQIGFFRNINNNNNNNNNVPTDQARQEDQAPSRLMVVWTFFATFFASLIPEIPNAV
ncbi:homocysteine-responsive endoplasmic reticulum-resident ubiquitin-like domain member 2 protein [Aethina tumida]|uniref:homocysteine-responsive endoplasmic reticulum-resident ubiquitin-like domain member 2 protein n=1 Tax=Aethina tumida TaxID=116153 RepID=UPI002147AD40|nr:homocysteine-responsive endoplasmic reticulum-resident ubiquitin-like domain member 2 protein [Aethina tumida]